MKKRITIFSVLMLVLVYSCRKSLMPNMDEGSAAMGKFNVNAAREHIKLLVKGEVPYDGKIALKTMSTTGTFTVNGVSQKTVKTGQKIFYPFWDRAITSNFKGKVDYVEVPIALSSRQIRLYQFPKDNIKQKPDASVAKAAFQRLVVYKDSKGGIGQRLLTYIPDKQYVMEHGYEASTNSLSKLNRDFFGYIEYKNWSGDIVSVLRIENGKVVRRYKVNKASKEQVQGLNLQRNAKSATGKVMSGGNTTSSTQEEVCNWEWIPIMETVCEVNDDGNPNDENLNEIECTLQEVGEYAAWVCTWVDVPDPEPCPWGDCGEEPCTDCENPCTDCEEPEPEPEDPCDKVKQLKKDANYNQKLDSLTSTSSQTHETAFTFGSAGYQISTGATDSPYVALNYTGTLDGYVHTHYGNGYSSFSLDDILAIAQLQADNKINNINTFTAGVISDKGTGYLLGVDNSTQWNTFATDHLLNPTNFASLSNSYNATYNLMKNTLGKSEIESREFALLTVLADSGTILFRGGKNSSGKWTSWQGVKKGSGINIENTNCN